MKAAAQRKMKPSGVDWIGDVPEGWGVGRVKHYYNIQLGKMLTSEQEAPTQSLERYYCAGDVHFGSVNGTDLKEMWFDRGEKITYEVEIGDLLVVEGGAGAGGAAIVRKQNVRAFIQNSIMRLRAEREADNGFLSYWMESLTRGGYVDLVCNKATIPHFTKQKLGAVPLPLPPLDEQKRIAAKLDRLCGRVDELAENIKGEIAALQEYRKSLITECVTKGLNPKAKMKPSGVDWIGKIPVGWTVMRLKYACSTITDGSHFSPECVDDGYPYVTATDVRGVGIDFERTKFVSEADYQALVAAGCGLKRDDVLIVKDGATTGRVGMMTDDTEAVALSSVAILRTPQDIDRKFLYWELQSDGLQRNIQQTMAGSAMPRITVWKLKQYNIALPLLDEQKEIAAFLDKRCAVIDAKITERQRQLEKLGEYRSSVIYEYVTGKREVSA